MNAFTLLKEDHKKVSGIFEKLEGTTERAEKTREELFAQLKQELEIHAHVEEEEGEMFKSAREVFPAERIEELGALMAEEKKAQQQKLKAASA